MLWSHKKYQKAVVRRGLAQVNAKNLLAQTIPDKILETKWSNPKKLEK